LTKARPIRTATERVIEVPRTARYYVLGEDGAADELWIVLHGFGQLAGDFVEYFSGLNDGRRLVVAPEALSRYYTVPTTAAPASERPVGATWMTREDRDNEIKDYVRYLDLLHAELTRRRAPSRTIVVGFSQGGATAARWAIHGESRIDRLILWGATVPPDANLGELKAALGGARLTLVIGRTDQYISSDAVASERSRLSQAGLEFDVVEYDAGHAIKRAVLLDVAAG
jgi:predicted esterase